MLKIHLYIPNTTNVCLPRHCLDIELWRLFPYQKPLQVQKPEYDLVCLGSNL